MTAAGDAILRRLATIWRWQVLARWQRFRLRPRAGTPLERLGSDYGGWWVPVAALRPGAVAYCVGVGEDMTFDLELHRRGLLVRAFDPTPRAIAHVMGNRPADHAYTFTPVGWWDRCGELDFYAPRDPAHVSHSAVNLQGTSESFTAGVTTYASVIEQYGDESVAIVKLDIEGAEHVVVPDVVRHPRRPQVLCVEYDQPVPLRSVTSTHRAVVGAGYELVHVEKWNYTYVRRDPDTDDR